MYIHAKVRAGMRKEEIRKISDDHFEIEVKEPARDNRANNRIIEILKAMYPTAIVRIINGHHSPSKLISIDLSDDV